MAKKAPAVGIDLGTTYSCVGVWKNDTVDIIANDQGNRTTPSYVAFTDSERLIGDAAKNQVARNPENTVFDAKRLIGRKFSDQIVQADIKLWPFKVESGANEKPMIAVHYNGEDKKFHPEEISSMILQRMMDVAEAYLGAKVLVFCISSEISSSSISTTYEPFMYLCGDLDFQLVLIITSRNRRIFERSK